MEKEGLAGLAVVVGGVSAGLPQSSALAVGGLRWTVYWFCIVVLEYRVLGW